MLEDRRPSICIDLEAPCTDIEDTEALKYLYRDGFTAWVIMYYIGA